MERIESNNQKASTSNKIGKIQKISPALQAYIKARDELIAKYAIKALPKWSLA